MRHASDELAQRRHFFLLHELGLRLAQVSRALLHLVFQLFGVVAKVRGQLLAFSDIVADHLDSTVVAVMNQTRAHVVIIWFGIPPLELDVGELQASGLRQALESLGVGELVHGNHARQSPPPNEVAGHSDDADRFIVDLHDAARGEVGQQDGFSGFLHQGAVLAFRLLQVGALALQFLIQASVFDYLGRLRSDDRQQLLIVVRETFLGLLIENIQQSDHLPLRPQRDTQQRANVQVPGRHRA